MMDMLNFSEASTLALHAMTILGECEAGKSMTTHQIAIALGASEAHLSKIMQRLKKAGLVESVRGPGGGSSLNKLPEDITLRSIFEVIEGPMNFSNCLLKKNACPRNKCLLGDLVQNLNSEIDRYMSQTTLADISEQGNENSSV